MPRIRFVPIALAGVVMAAPSRAAAQDASCPYASCALRVEYRFNSPQVVMGAAGSKASRPGFGGIVVPALAAARDPAHAEYAAYRRLGPTQVAIGLASLGVGVAGLIVIDRHHYSVTSGPALAFIIPGTVLGFIGTVVHTHALNHLERAVWTYNQGLSR